MKLKRTLFFIILIFSYANVSAQFYSAGDDPASIRWNSLDSKNFKIIYPRNIDSLAAEYLRTLEKYRPKVSYSAGYLPGKLWLGRTPVVLHAYNAISNGSVAIAPFRMDFFTSPPAYAPEPLPWMKMLSIHESRHAAQMQFGYSYVFRPFYWIFGEMFSGLMTGLYPDMWLLEGDAVVTETALTKSGRGRVANFLNYYRIAFDNGDFRSVDRWAYGSYKHYTPDHYAYGYMTIGGFRYFHDYPYFMRDMIHTYSKRPYNLFTRNTVSRKITGKGFRKASADIFRNYKRMWSEEMQERGPLTPYSVLTKSRKTFTEYGDNIIVGEDLYSIKESFDAPRKLVKINKNGREKTVCTFAGEVGMLRYSPALKRLFWSETIPGMRWSQNASSVIKYMDTDSEKRGKLTRKGIMYNPCPSPTDSLIAVTEYIANGRSLLTILDGSAGTVKTRYEVPDTLQLVESAWIGNSIYATAISDSGYGIYRLHADRPGRRGGNSDYFWETVLSPSPVMIFNFVTFGDNLSFTSDISGTEEVYVMDVTDGGIYRKTSSKYGFFDFTFSNDGDLFCSQRGHKGVPIVKIHADSLLNEEVDWSKRYKYKIADRLSEQEDSLAAIYESAQSKDVFSYEKTTYEVLKYEKDGSHEKTTYENIKYKVIKQSLSDSISIGQPKRYRKFPHLFNIHSWAPVYFNVDNIRSSSADYGYEFASLGAAAAIQNRLGTFTANFGYSAHKDPADKRKWRHSGHIKLNYSGLYPVIEAQIDINDRAARMTSIYKYCDGNDTRTATSTRKTNKPYISGGLSVYVPLSFASGGWNKGIIPKISWNINNDRTDKGEYLAFLSKDAETGIRSIVPFMKTGGGKVLTQRLSASLRMYVVRSRAHSEIYPDWGIGGELGVSSFLGMGNLSGPVCFAYIYGYLPGITGNQGIRLSAKYQHISGKDNIYLPGFVNTLPRGLYGNEELLRATAFKGSGLSLSADYAIPFYMGDFHIGNLFYVNRGILTPHFDYSILGKYHLWSAGATLEINFGNFFGLGFPTKAGVTCSYNSGRSFKELKIKECSRFFIGPVFSMDF